MADNKITIPDIGGATAVEVIEVMVKIGDTIEKDTPLITLESDKASMEIPSPVSGVIKEILIKVGDKVSEGDLIVSLQENTTEDKKQEKPVENTAATQPKKMEAPDKAAKAEIKQAVLVKIPDIGGAEHVEVIEVLVKKGDEVKKDQALLTLEGDKATMDIPSPYTGLVTEVTIAVGDKVSKDSAILTIETTENADKAPSTQLVNEKKEVVEKIEDKKAPNSVKTVASISKSTDIIAAGPAVRRIARELGVDLSQVKGSGRKNRISKDDIHNFVKTKLAEKSNDNGLKIASTPAIDFSRFGETSTSPLNKIKRLTATNVHRSWLTIPHVTQFDEADITELELFRKAEQSQNETKLTILAFITKAVCKALKTFPQFNSSLDANGENLILKNYFNIGIAVETPSGLVVPVIKAVDTLSVLEIATEMSRLSKVAREKGLAVADMSGGSFTISSLGGIGGTAFTPIVNSPEVAILGLSRSRMQPVYDGKEFKPRLMLPLSLSYDHRVIDGAEAARFTRYIADSIADIRRLLL